MTRCRLRRKPRLTTNRASASPSHSIVHVGRGERDPIDVAPFVTDDEACRLARPRGDGLHRHDAVGFAAGTHRRPGGTRLDQEPARLEGETASAARRSRSPAPPRRLVPRPGPRGRAGPPAASSRRCRRLGRRFWFDPGGVQHGAQGQAEVVVGQGAGIGTGETNRHALWRLTDVRDHRRRQLDLGDAVEVERRRRAQPREQVVDRRGVADRVGFEREAVSPAS